jgi:hypothetical protein
MEAVWKPQGRSSVACSLPCPGRAAGALVLVPGNTWPHHPHPNPPLLTLLCSSSFPSLPQRAPSPLAFVPHEFPSSLAAPPPLHAAEERELRIAEAKKQRMRKVIT